MSAPAPGSGPVPSPSKAPDDFLERARRLLLLDDDAVEKLRAEAAASQLSPENLALRSGLLDSVQIDVIETLRNPDTIVPGYQMLDLIAQGGMGVVFRARQISLDRIVAVKTILVSQMHDRTALTRFEQEAVAVARLRHPNIVAAHDLGRHEGRLFFVMELLEGSDVERTIQLQGPLAEWEAWGLIRQAAAGLSHAAAAGIVHRDIKPANMLLVDPPAGFEIPGGLKMVKITDFGLAFLTRDIEIKTRLTSANAAIGSPHYIAPEQLEIDTVDHRADIYSLGATAYQMLTGEPPFHGKKLPQIVAMKLSLEAIDVKARCPEISDDSAELIRRMTQRDPQRRIGTYAELIAHIDALVPRRVPAASGLPLPPTGTQPTVLIRSDPTPDALPRDTITLAAAAQPNTTSPQAPQRRRRGRGKRRSRGARNLNRRSFLGLAVGGLSAAAVAGLGAGAWWRFGRQQPAKAARILVPTGLSVNLFDGMTLGGWRTSQGAWRVSKNREGGRVLAGSSGLTGRLLFGGRENRDELENYRVSVGVQLNGATAAEIEFALSARNRDRAKRGVARLTPHEITVGHRIGSEGPLKEPSKPLPLPPQKEEPYTISVERQPETWNVFLNQTLVGALPIEPRPDAAEINLRAVDGEVWFSDITLQALGPAPDTTT